MEYETLLVDTWRESKGAIFYTLDGMTKSLDGIL